MNDICAINKLPSDILYYLSNWLKLNDYYNLSQISSYYRVTITNHDSYWRKRIIIFNIPSCKNNQLIKPFYFFLYCFRFIKFDPKANYLNHISLEPNKWYQGTDLKSISKSPITLYNSAKSFEINIKTKIKLNGYYRVIWIIKTFSNSFLSDLHCILSNDNDFETFNKINSIDYPSKKLNQNSDVYLLGEIKSKKDYVHNIFSIYDQHKIRNKGWKKLVTSNIYLKSNNLLSIKLFNNKGIFYKYTLDGVYLIKVN